jgi:thiol-disulfide isomerase/thioredoxin
MNTHMQKNIIAISLVVIGVTTSYLAVQKYIENQSIEQQIPELQENILENFMQELEEESQVQEPKKIIEIDQEDTLRAALHNDKQPSVIFFHMDGCGWCKKMAPVFEQIAKDPKFADLQFYNVNGRSAQAPVVVKELFNQQITGYPFFLFVDEKGFIDKQSGFMEQDKFENKIQGLFPAFFPNFVAPQVQEKREQPSSCGQARQQAEQNQQPALPKPDNVTEIATQDQLLAMFEHHDDKAVIFFHMDGCGWCKKMTPVFYQAAQNKDFASLKFYSVNGRSAQAPIVVKELFDQQINGYPFFLFINEDGFVDKQPGFADQEKFENKIKESFFK